MKRRNFLGTLAAVIAIPTVTKQITTAANLPQSLRQLNIPNNLGTRTALEQAEFLNYIDTRTAQAIRSIWAKSNASL